MTWAEAMRYVAQRLSPVTDEAWEESRLIIRRLSGMDRGGVFLDRTELGEDVMRRIEDIVERRLKHEPVQYILGEWGFMGLDLTVTPAALIPRQDTETLCEEAIGVIRGRGYKTLLDICTGTGCIAISLNKLTGISAEASDISEECVSLARENALKNGAEVSIRRADLFDGAGVYDLVTANPPYISAADMASLQPVVRSEPALALLGGADGLDFYRSIAAEAGEHIAPGGALLLEVGCDEAEPVRAMFPGRETRAIKDLNGIDRVVEIRF